MDLIPLDLSQSAALPSRKDEDWRWSDLAQWARGQAALTSESVPVQNFATGSETLQWVALGTTAGFDEVLNLESEAHVTRFLLLDDSEAATRIHRTTVHLADRAIYRQFIVTRGAGFQRLETHVCHKGEGSEAELNAAYLLSRARHFDLTTRVTHLKQGGRTRQLAKGLVKDKARAVFQGRITVAVGADQTDARMTHHALILNDGAQVRAKPELQIFADEVSCAHGNTIGALDEGALFFCQSRGMDASTARALLTRAFVAPVIESIIDEGSREQVQAFLDRLSEVFHDL